MYIEGANSRCLNAPEGDERYSGRKTEFLAENRTTGKAQNKLDWNVTERIEYETT